MLISPGAATRASALRLPESVVLEEEFSPHLADFAIQNSVAR